MQGTFEAGQVTLLQFDRRVRSIATGLGAGTFQPIWPAVAQMCVSDVKKNFNESHSPEGVPWIPLAHGRPGSKGRDKPLRDTGILMASITGRADENGVTIGTNHEARNVHQFGAIITPKRSKFLAIPLTQEAKRAESPRNWGNTKWRFIPTKTGGWVMLAARPLSASQQAGIAIRRLEGKKLTASQQRLLAAIPQYVLVKSVTVPARPYLGFSQPLLQRIEQLVLNTAADAVMRGLKSGERQTWIDAYRDGRLS